MHYEFNGIVHLIIITIGHFWYTYNRYIELINHYYIQNYSMPAKRNTPALPKWMKEKPTGEMLVKIKENSYEFISTKIL